MRTLRTFLFAAAMSICSLTMANAEPIDRRPSDRHVWYQIDGRNGDIGYYLLADGKIYPGMRRDGTHFVWHRAEPLLVAEYPFGGPQSRLPLIETRNIDYQTEPPPKGLARVSAPKNSIVDKSLRTYCDRNGLTIAQLELADLPLLPGTIAYRYRLKPIASDKESHGFFERFGVVFVDSTYGGIIEFKLNTDDDFPKTRRQLLAALTLRDRKASTPQEASMLIAHLFTLDGWLTGYSLEPHRVPSPEEIKEGAGLYRSRPHTYGDGGRGCLKLVGGDDFGIEVDAQGYVVAFLCGHIR